MSVRVLGVKETIRELKEVGPDIQKQFRRDVKVIVQPIIDQAKTDYGSQDPPSGTARNWQQNGRQKFPLSASKSKSGMKPSIKTGKRNSSTILVIQRNPGAAIFEFANTGSLGEAFRGKNGHPARVVWPAAEKQLPRVIGEMTELVKKVEVMVNRRIL